MRKVASLLCLVLFVCSTWLYAQQKQITGKVLPDDGKPVSGAWCSQ